MLASTEFVRVGSWVFGTGVRDRNAEKLFHHIDTELNRLGSSMSLVARLDQYYPQARCVAPYQAARKRAFERRQVAPSTSVIVSALQDPQAEFDVQVMAATSESGLEPEEIGAGLNRPETSGYTPCLRVGDLVFVAGQLARASRRSMRRTRLRAERRAAIRFTSTVASGVRKAGWRKATTVVGGTRPSNTVSHTV